jgi:hypothetical protein
MTQSSDVKGPIEASFTNIRRSGESPGRGQLHKATDLQDGSSFDDVGLIVGCHHERRLLGALIDSLKASGGAAAIYGEPGMGRTSLLRFGTAPPEPGLPTLWLAALSIEECARIANATGMSSRQEHWPHWWSRREATHSQLLSASVWRAR